MSFHLLPRFSKVATCLVDKEETERIEEIPLWSGKSITFHHLGLIISATFGLLAVVTALFLILRHATHFSKPSEQKYIIRILVMIPIYAVVSFLSYLNYRHAVYFEVIRDCYEAFAIASFFALLCHYVAPTLHDQKEAFRTLPIKNWVMPLNWMQKCTGGENKGMFRKPQSGLTWFNVIWISIFQYCFIRPFFTVVAVITQANHRYCQSSRDPRFAYVWVSAFEAISVTIAMYCLIQFYIQLKADLAPHRPFLKVLCIKLVIFFCFWQSLVVSFLASDGGPLKPSTKIAEADLKIGIPSMLVCIEMSAFAVLHLWAFPWKPYDLKGQALQDGAPKRYAHGPARAIASTLNPMDIVKALGRGVRWLFVGRRHRHQDVSYQTKLGDMGPDTAYHQGPTFAGTGEAATEFGKPKKASGKNSGFEDSDTAGLLSHAQTNPYMRQDTDHQMYVGTTAQRYDPDRLPAAPTPAQEYDLGSRGRNHLFEQETTYYGGAPRTNPRSARFDKETGADLGRPSTEWDMFAGATKPGAKPPPYGGPPPGMI